MEKILTVTDVAEILQVKPITVREMLRTERIRGFKVGKAWRTTEKMLREDIEKLARGEEPEKLPKNNNGAAKPQKTRKKKADTVDTPQPKIENKEPAKNDNGHAPTEEEIAQQLLF